MLKFFNLLTIENIKNSLPQVVIIVSWMLIAYIGKGYIDAKDEVLKCQLMRVDDFKDLRDQAVKRMEKAESRTDSNKTQINVLKKRVKK